MKNLFASIALFCLSICYSQTDTEIDILTTEICKTLEENKQAPDSLNVSFAFQKHFPLFLEKHKIDSEEKYNTVTDRIFFRLQKNCNFFVALLARNNENKSEWEVLQTAPPSNIQKKDCKKLTAIKKFYYLEQDGKKVHVTIDNGKWIEKFEDGTYSNLNFKWTSDCEFEIEFIESNNNMRKNLSFKGDKYNYVLYETKDNDLKFYVKTSTAVVQSSWLHAE
jgi:hypothetical protein